MVWTLARAQAAAGHEVHVVVTEPPDAASTDLARRGGVSLLYIKCGRFRFDPAMLAERLQTLTPDVVHLHSVFMHPLTTLAKALRRACITYVATLHGGLAPQVLSRRPIRKLVYSALFERDRLRHAGAISLVGPGETAHIRSYLPGYTGPTPWIPNPVHPESVGQRQWSPPAGRPRLVFLGRFDVHGKGIDLLVHVAHHLPDADIHLYGTEDARSLKQLNALKASATPNVTFHPPVYGDAKADVLADAMMYLQLSRWEGFPVSVAEAMCLGTPCAINQDLAIEGLFRERDLGLLVPDNAPAAAKLIAQAIADPQRLATWSTNGQRYAADQLRPERAAAEYTRLYRQAMSTRSGASVLGRRATNSTGQ
jgi:glycosyltransferase involved in cell wall biosynthesis